MPPLFPSLSYSHRCIRSHNLHYSRYFQYYCLLYTFVPGDVTGTVAGNRNYYRGMSTAAVVRALSHRIICDNRHYS